MRKSLYTDVLAVQSLTQASRTANAAVNGTAVDRSQFQNYAKSAMVVVQTGTITDGSTVITLEESDDNSSWATATELQGSAPTIVAANDNVVFQFGYTGSKRYLRVVATTSGATSGGVFGAVILLADARRTPIARA